MENILALTKTLFRFLTININLYNYFTRIFISLEKAQNSAFTVKRPSLKTILIQRYICTSNFSFFYSGKNQSDPTCGFFQKSKM